MALCGNSKSEIENRIMELANSLNITDILYKFPYEISGGQKQRAACARALVNFPKLILADEPTGNLDSENEEKIVLLLQSLARQDGYTVIVITHNPRVEEAADHVFRMKDGTLTYVR